MSLPSPGGSQKRMPSPPQLSSKLKVVKAGDLQKAVKLVQEDASQQFFHLNPQNLFLNKKRYSGTPLKTQRIYHLKNRTSKETNSDIRPFSYISQLYKKPIERQIQLQHHKQKKETPEFTNILKYKSIKLQPKRKPRQSKTSQARCRCHNNSKSVDMKLIKNNTWLPKTSRPKPYKPQIQKKVKKVINITAPQNWMLDSWSIYPPNKAQTGSPLLQFSKFG